MASNYKFIYKDNVYKGNKVDKNFKFIHGYLDYKGDPYDGTIGKIFYSTGGDFNEQITSSPFYSNTGKTMTIEIDLPLYETVKYNKKNISANNGATIKSVKYVKATHMRSPKLAISLGKTKMNTKYSVSIKNVSVGKHKPFTFKHQFSGLTSKTLASKNYRELKKYYDKYKNYTAKEASTVDIYSGDNIYEAVMNSSPSFDERKPSPDEIAVNALSIYLYDKFKMRTEL